MKYITRKIVIYKVISKELKIFMAVQRCDK